MISIKQLFFAGTLLYGMFVSAQVGIGTVSPNASAVLDLSSTTSGFLPPRMTSLQKMAIATPVTGLLIWCSDCGPYGQLENYNGTAWSSLDGIIRPYGSNLLIGNASCPSKIISVTPCSSVAGATINDDATTTLGTEYDWSDATSAVLGIGFGATTNTRSLVQIGQQCWAKFNSKVVNTANYTAVQTVNADTGNCIYFNSATNESVANYGLIYQWSAAMNSTNGLERGQGVCPLNWHVPSDCEWMLLENTLGMTITYQQQALSTFRTSGSVGSDLSSLTSGGTNASGFSGFLSGWATSGPVFKYGSVAAYFYSSTVTSTGSTSLYPRGIYSGSTGTNRSAQVKSGYYSLRCLKD